MNTEFPGDYKIYIDDLSLIIGNKLKTTVPSNQYPLDIVADIRFVSYKEQGCASLDIYVSNGSIPSKLDLTDINPLSYNYAKSIYGIWSKYKNKN